jgi:hypothetical protein
MVYRTVGSSGLKVSVVGPATRQLGGEWGTTFTADVVVAQNAGAADLPA